MKKYRKKFVDEISDSESKNSKVSQSHDKFEISAKEIRIDRDLKAKENSLFGKQLKEIENSIERISSRNEENFKEKNKQNLDLVETASENSKKIEAIQNRIKVIELGKY